MTTIFAHRGSPRVAPENTLPSFKAAAEAGAAWIEADVDLTRDGTPLVIHDSTLDRTTDRSGPVYEVSAEDLPRIDAGGWFSSEFEGTRVPTLRELIDLMNEQGLNANIELKPHESGAEGTLRLVEEVATELERLDGGREVIVSSFSPLTLAALHGRAPWLPLGVLYEPGAVRPDWKSVLELTGAGAIHLADQDATAENVAAAHKAGYAVNVYTLNDPDRAWELMDLGVDGIFTDLVGEMVELAAAHEAGSSQSPTAGAGPQDTSD